MSRIVKFRAWDNKNKNWLNRVPPNEYMLDCDDWSTPDYGDMCEGLMFYPNNPMGPDFDGRIIYEQFTGAKDKNNKEIYEGDILRIEGEMICNFFVPDHPISNINKFSKTEKIKYSYNAKVIYDDGYAQFLFEYIYRPNCEDRGSFCGVAFFSEIIGNIHENPELLK